MSAHKHFQAERLQALPTGPTGGHLAGSLELPRLGRTTVPRLRRGWAGQRLPLQPAAYLGCVYILTRLAEPPHPAAFPSAGWALRSLLSPQAGAPPSSLPPSSTNTTMYSSRPRRGLREGPSDAVKTSRCAQEGTGLRLTVPVNRDELNGLTQLGCLSSAPSFSPPWMSPPVCCCYSGG